MPQNNKNQRATCSGTLATKKANNIWLIVYDILVFLFYHATANPVINLLCNALNPENSTAQ